MYLAHILTHIAAFNKISVNIATAVKQEILITSQMMRLSHVTSTVRNSQMLESRNCQDNYYESPF